MEQHHQEEAVASHVPCRFFLSGNCFKGSECSFSHDPASTVQTSPHSPTACSFFLKGNCTFGNNCRFRHEAPQLAESIPSTHQTSSTMSSTGPASFKVPSNRAPVESLTLNMQALRLPKKAASGDRPARTWADAPEFVPRGAAQPDQPKSWAHVVNPVAMAEMTAAEAETELCPFGVNGECRFGEGGCSYVHGDVCEMCGSAALHPTHQEQRRQHEFICMKQHEHDMEVAFAYAKSKEKTCGICMEVVVDKHPKGEARFGIMPSCNHCFCLGCLRTWRQAKNFESKVIRSCPECRITSDFICPSRFWVDTEAEKAELLSSYKSNQATKDCKYFMNGEAECPFGNKCFYRHVTKDGRGVDVGPPPRNVIQYLYLK